MATIPLRDTPFYDFFREEADVTVYYNDLLPGNEQFRVVRSLGSGDEGEVYLVALGDQEYALKNFKPTHSLDPAIFLEQNKVLETIGVAPRYHYVAWYDDHLFVLREVYDITLADYLERHPEKTEFYLELCIELLTNLLSQDYFDYDFNLRNVALNLDRPYRLYFIDVSLDRADAEPEEVEEIMASLSSE